MLVEVHSKDFVIQWVDVPAGSSLHYKVVPLRRSVNFGVFERTATEPGVAHVLASAHGTLHERLNASGLTAVSDQDLRRIHGNTTLEGTVVPVERKQHALLAFVFDNRFSKSKAKTIECTFHIRDPSDIPRVSEDDDGGSVRKVTSHQAVRPRSSTVSQVMSAPVLSTDGRFLTGFLQKKRRKNFQGYARRYFSLDMRLGLLNYYLNQKSSFLRGVMPVKIADVTVSSPIHREITVDSGVEKWSLRALDTQAFFEWSKALRSLQDAGRGEVVAAEQREQETPASFDTSSVSDEKQEPSLERTSTLTAIAGDWEAVHHAISELRDLLPTIPFDSGTRLKDIISKLQKAQTGGASKDDNAADSNDENAIMSDSNGEVDKKSAVSHLSALTKRPSVDLEAIGSRGALIGAIAGILAGIFTGTLIGAIAVAIAGATLGASTSVAGHASASRRNSPNSEAGPLAGTMAASLVDVLMDDTDDDNSSDAAFSDDSDIEETEHGAVCYVPQRPQRPNQLPESMRGPDSDILSSPTLPSSATSSSSSSSGLSALSSLQDSSTTKTLAETEFVLSEAETSLYPLPHDPVHRRTQIASPTWNVPSLLNMVKKASGNGGSMSVPAAANEPLTVCERIAEMYCDSKMLDIASDHPRGSHLRQMYVALFAISFVSTNLSKERAIRKPFTPLLGETYEMVREDAGLRFVAEKVVHKPLVIATQAESPKWTVHFTARPIQKMWAKSVQILDTGPIQVSFPDDENVTFLLPELFLRNILAGERYVEPNGTTIVESSTGTNATIEFKSGGMFSGRTEEIRIVSGSAVFAGKWTTEIEDQASKRVVWRAPALVAEPNHHYGFLKYSAGLNETTELERGALPPTDSRLRLDIKAMEEQNIDDSEKFKAELEQNQRDRRHEFEAANRQWEPQFFAKSSNSHGYYVLHKGSRNYWVRRKAHNWDGIIDIFS